MDSSERKNPAFFHSKVVLPRLRPNRVERRQLAERIEENTWRKLTLICAPAGFGKTTLLREWTQLTRRKVCYTLLDESDNLPHHFLRYFLESIREQFPGFGRDLDAWMSQAVLPEPVETAASLVAELNTLGEEIAVVLDDYQVIHHDFIHNLVREIISHAPEQVHIILISREEPPFSLAGMRARDDILEIRMNDLRFSRQEILAFMNEKMGLRLDDAQIDLLLGRTEGWAAGIQLAALSIREAVSTDSLFKELSGSNRYILEFLMQEVLDRLDANTREFLLRCSVLDRLTQPLCLAISLDLPEIPDLADLESRNLFLSALDQDRAWFRLHPLFADSLRFRLQKEKGVDAIREIYRLAAVWEAENALLPESVRHYHLAGDVKSAGDMASVYSALLLGKGESARCIEWLDQLPAPVTNSNFGVQLVYGYAFISTGQRDRVPGLIIRAQALLDSFKDYLNESTRMTLQARIYSIQSLLASEKGEIEETIRFADQAIPYLESGDAVRKSISLGKAIAYHNRGMIRKSIELLEETCANLTRPEENQIHLVCLCNLGDTYLEIGDFERGFQVLRKAEDFGLNHPEDDQLVLAMAYYGQSIYWYEKNRLDSALEMAEKALPLARKWGNIDIHCGLILQLVQIQMARGNTISAMDYLSKTGDLVKSSGRQVLVSDHLMNARLRMELARGDRAEVSRLLREDWSDLSRPTDFLAEALWIERAHAELWLNGSMSDEAARHLAEIPSAGRADRLANALMAELLLMVQSGQFDAAEVERVLGNYQRLGYHRVLTDHQAVLGPFFQVGYDQLTESTRYYLDLVIGKPEVNSPVVVQHPNLAAADVLTEREVEVVRYLQAGLSNTEIARRMYLSPGTVKRHLHNIFQKLGVESRLAAVARAIKAGYIS
jgi:LuxR family maltose regulon positive regulatory protein